MELVSLGIPFRQAYQTVGNNLDSLESKDSISLLQLSDHIGGTGNLGLDKSEEEHNEQKIIWQKEEKQFKESLALLIDNKAFLKTQITI
jgi:argininosuccinate lyase